MPLVTQNGSLVVTTDEVDPSDVVYHGGIAVRASDGAVYCAFFTSAGGAGSINASVQPRSGALASLITLDGLVGEHSYPTDAANNVHVQHTGVAGEAIPSHVNAAVAPFMYVAELRMPNGTGDAAASPFNASNEFVWSWKTHGDYLLWTAPDKPVPDGTLTIDVSDFLTIGAVLFGASNPTLGATFAFTNLSANISSLIFKFDGVTVTEFRWGALQSEVTNFRVTYDADSGEVSVRQDNSQFSNNAVISATGATTDAAPAYAPTYNLSPNAVYATHTFKLPPLSSHVKKFGRIPFVMFNSSANAITALTVQAQAGETIRGTAITAAAFASKAYAMWMPTTTGDWLRIV